MLSRGPARPVVVTTTGLVAALLTGWAVSTTGSSEPSTVPTAAAGSPLVVRSADPLGTERAAAVPTVPSVPSVPTVPAVTARPATAATGPGLPPPTELVLPRLAVRMPLRAMGVAQDGAMQVPEDPRLAGWYRFGPVPGGPAGAAVLAAHVDSRRFGTGPLARLASMRPGDPVVVTVAGRPVRYRVSEVVEVVKTQLSTTALFDRSGPPRLHIVTCTGRFDQTRRSYERNLILTARPWPS